MTMNRRSFLQTGALAGATLWLPRRARGDVSSALRRAMILYLPGGVRWQASFHAADAARQNPFGRLPFSLVPPSQRAHAETPGAPWALSRALHMRPEVFAACSAGQRDRLRTCDAADLCFAEPRLSRWPGRPTLPSLVATAPRIGVLSCDGAPGGEAVLEHGPAQRLLFTGDVDGERGVLTRLAAALGGRTRLPPVALDAPGFVMGARPVDESEAAALDPGEPLLWLSGLGVPRLGAGGEKLGAALALADDAALGRTVGGAPLTNGMLRQLFAPANESDGPAALDDLGAAGARALRLLQAGAPVVACAAGDFDSHQDELGRAAALPRVGRLLSSLAFALHNMIDDDSGAPLWDSTLVVVVSEFGRGGPNLGADGFNLDRGSDHDRAQLFPIFGGPLRRPGQVIDDGGRPFATARLWTTLQAALGAPDDRAARVRHPEIPDLLRG